MELCYNKIKKSRELSKKQGSFKRVIKKAAVVGFTLLNLSPLADGIISAKETNLQEIVFKQPRITNIKPEIHEARINPLLVAVISAGVGFYIGLQTGKRRQ